MTLVARLNGEVGQGRALLFPAKGIPSEEGDPLWRSNNIDKSI